MSSLKVELNPKMVVRFLRELKQAPDLDESLKGLAYWLAIFVERAGISYTLTLVEELKSVPLTSPPEEVQRIKFRLDGFFGGEELSGFAVGVFSKEKQLIRFDEVLAPHFKGDQDAADVLGERMRSMWFESLVNDLGFIKDNS